jgi:hypothetical protein
VQSKFTDVSGERALIIFRVEAELIGEKQNVIYIGQLQELHPVLPYNRHSSFFQPFQKQPKPNSIALNKEAARSFETSAQTYYPTQRKNPP